MRPKINRIFAYLDKNGLESYFIEIQYDICLFYDFKITKEQAIELSELLDLGIENY